MFAAADYLHSWRDRREAEYKNMTEEEVFDRIANAMERIAGAMELYVESFCLPQNVGIPCPYDEIQHVSYDDAQLGREK